MNPRVRTSHAPVFKVIALFVVLSFLMLSSGCGGAAPAAAPGSTQVAQPSDSGWTVSCEAAKVWASITAGTPNTLDVLAQGASNTLAANGYVTCDSSGKAELTKTGCSVTVYTSSGLKMTACTGQPGSWTCAVGTSLDKCIANIMTASANVTIRGGTWVSVTALDEGRLTIVTVSDGGADVVPVTVLDGSCKIQDDHSLSCSFANRQVDGNQTVKLNAAQGPTFTYTAPDAYLAQLQAKYSLPPARQALPLDQLPQLILPLQESFPELRLWMDGLYRQASIDKAYFPPIGVPPGVILHGGGGWLQDMGLQEVVLRGVNWPNAIEKAFGGKAVNLAVDMPNQQVPDASSIPFDPGFASDAVKNMNPDVSKRVTLLVPGEDSELVALADAVASSLKEIGLSPEIAATPASEMYPKTSTKIAAGEPVLWLSRQ